MLVHEIIRCLQVLRAAATDVVSRTNQDAVVLHILPPLIAEATRVLDA